MGIQNRKRAVEAYKANKSMRPTVAFFLLFLADLASDAEGRIYRSNAKLADDVGRDVRYVTRYRTHLQELGLIDVVDRGGPNRVSTWQLFPAHYGHTGAIGAMGTRVPPVVHTGGTQVWHTGGLPKEEERTLKKEHALHDSNIRPGTHIPVTAAGDTKCFRCGNNKNDKVHDFFKKSEPPETSSDEPKQRATNDGAA